MENVPLRHAHHVILTAMVLKNMKRICRKYLFAVLLLASGVIFGVLSIGTVGNAVGAGRMHRALGASPWIVETPAGAIAPACGCTADVGLRVQTIAGSRAIHTDTLATWKTRIIGRDGVNYGIGVTGITDSHALPFYRQGTNGLDAFMLCSEVEFPQCSNLFDDDDDALTDMSDPGCTSPTDLLED